MSRSRWRAKAPISPSLSTLSATRFHATASEEAFWLKPGIAFMKITAFNENTSQEMDENLKRLGENNIKGLVFDLRQNPGGLLNEGVAVAGHFLRKGEVVVSQRGRASAEKPYSGARKCERPELSRSWCWWISSPLRPPRSFPARCRITIALGFSVETTFGKGLVQTVYPLDDNTGLALTTAHYYTPSGRLIQRDYSNISFLDYYYGKRTDTKNLQDVKSTDSGRTVYGGGGITPDEKYVPAKYNKFQTRRCCASLHSSTSRLSGLAPGPRPSFPKDGSPIPAC